MGDQIIPEIDFSKTSICGSELRITNTNTHLRTRTTSNYDVKDFECFCETTE